MTAVEIIRELKRNHPASFWACVTEMRSAGYKGEQRKIDLWAMSCEVSKGMPAHSYEVKVSRSDWLSELRKPTKKRLAMAISNYFWIVAPPGVVKPSEVFPMCGLIEISPNGGYYSQIKVIEAEYRDKVRPTWALVAQMARSFYRNEILKGVKNG